VEQALLLAQMVLLLSTLANSTPGVTERPRPSAPLRHFERLNPFENNFHKKSREISRFPPPKDLSALPQRAGSGEMTRGGGSDDNYVNNARKNKTRATSFSGFVI